MATVWKTLVSSLSLEDGKRRDNPPEIGAVEATAEIPPGSQHKGNLYVLCELSAPAETWDDASTQIVDLAIRTFFESLGSVTAGLRQAVLAVNRHLADTNATSIAGQEVWAGMTCVALREHDLFIAQGGPALTHVLHRGELLTYPEPDSALGDVAPPQPLGEILQPDIELFHCTVAQGDVLLLTVSHLPHLANTEQIMAALREDTPDSALAHIEELVAKRDFSAVAIRLVGTSTTPETESVQTKPAPAALPTEKERTPLDLDQVPPPTLAEEAEKEAAEDETWERDEVPRQSSVGIALARIVETFSLFVALILRALARLIGAVGAVGGGIGRAVGPAFEGIGRAVVALFGFFGSRSFAIARQMLPGVSPPTPKTRQPQARPQKTKPAGRNLPLILIGLLVPLLLIGLAAGYWLRQSQARQAQVDTAMTQAKNALQSTSSMPRDEARKALTDALTAVAEARQLDPQAAGAEALESDLAQALDRINGVARLVSLTELANFTIPEGRDPRRLALTKDALFVLDAGLDRVIRYRRSGATLEPSEPVLQVGQTVDSQTVGELLDIAWVEPGNGRPDAGLLVLTENRHLFEITDQGAARSDDIAQADTWKQPVRIDTFVGNLYVLDAGVPQIFKYAPTPEGSYALPPEAWFAEGQAQVQNPAAMVIDGNIYLLQADGTALKFMAGEMQDFPMDGLDTPIVSPRGIFAHPDGKYLFVGDPTRKRVVVFDKDGHFVRQLQTTQTENDPLEGLVSLAVDESQNQIYFLDSGHLWGAGIPPLTP